MSRSFWSLGSQRGDEEREETTAERASVETGDVKAELARLSAEVSRLCEAQAEMRAALLLRAEGPGSGPSPAAVQSAESRVWQSAPLGTRLRFLAELLDEDHPLHKPVREAESLIGLARRGSELEDWLGSYPSLFVDAYSALIVAPCPAEAPALELVAGTALEASRDVLDGQLDGFGVTWIAPVPGESPGAEHVIAGEEPSAEATPGSVVRCARRGLRRRGRVLLPAQVYVARAAAGNASTAAAPPEKPPVGANDPTPAAPADEWPDWLRTLHRASQRESAPAITDAVAGLTRLVGYLTEGEAADDEALRGVAAPLLPLLGGAAPVPTGTSGTWAEELARTRPAILAWLSDSASLELIAPAAGDGFDSETMQATSIRRTAHPHEHGLVAKLEGPGFRREGRPIIPARVVQYRAGDQE